MADTGAVNPRHLPDLNSPHENFLQSTSSNMKTGPIQKMLERSVAVSISLLTGGPV